MAPLPVLQRFRKGRGKQKDDAEHQGKDFPVKIRVVGAPADRYRDPDLSLRLSTTQEELLKDLSLYVKKNDAPAPPAPGQAAITGTAAAASTASPSANTAATVPASPLEGLLDTPDGAKNGSSAAAPTTSMSVNVPTNLVGNISAITRQSEEEAVFLKNGNAKTKAVVPTTSQPKTYGARPRSLRDAFDSATDAKIFGDAEDLHGDPEFARRNSISGKSNHDSTSVGGFSPYGEINDTSTTISSVGKERPIDTSRSSREKIPTASTSSKARTIDVSVNQEQDNVGSSYDDSYSFNESYEEEFGKMSLYEELIDFFCGDCAVPTQGGDRDRRSRSSAATGRHRRRRSSSRRSEGRRPPRDDGSRRRSSASRSRRHK